MRIFTPNGFQVNAKNPESILKYFIVFQVSAAGANAQGSGPNKKLAKRSAAESLLQIMGYSRPSLQPAKPALKNTNSNGSTASSSTSSTMSTSSITNGELKTTHSTNSLASKDKTKKVNIFFKFNIKRQPITKLHFGYIWGIKKLAMYQDSNSGLTTLMFSVNSAHSDANAGIQNSTDDT